MARQVPEGIVGESTLQKVWKILISKINNKLNSFTTDDFLIDDELEEIVDSDVFYRGDVN